MPLTDTAIHNAKPGDKTKKMFDSGGLYLEVAPSGGNCIYRIPQFFGFSFPPNVPPDFLLMEG